MEFTRGRMDSRFYTEEEEEEEGDGGHPFLPVSSSAPSSSSAIVAAVPTSTAAVEKEHMFEKVVTPSDVGKLNRLVIPKQHAEKYFPLDASTHEKGLLLNFEDRNGKPWRFRYSYWNSSQSYVMTKGWSRFVKEKRLDAGDTVSFGRGSGENARHRLFIDWKRRPDPHLNQLLPSVRVPRFPYNVHSNLNLTPSSSSGHPHPYLSFTRSAAAPWAAGRLFVPHATPAPPTSNYFYYRPTAALAAQTNNPVPMVLDSVPVAHGMAATAPKRVRLFGVNLEQPREAASNSENANLLRLQLRAPDSSPELRLGGIETSSAASSSSSSNRGANDTQHSPQLASTCDTYFKLN